MHRFAPHPRLSRTLIALAVLAAALGAVPAARADTLTKAPELARFVEAVPGPGAPDIARRTSVLLELTILPNGGVADVALIVGAHPVLDAAALKAVSQFLFVPVEIDGKPATVRLRYEYVYEPPAVKPMAPAPSVTPPLAPPPPAAPVPPTASDADDLVAVGHKDEPVVVRREISLREIETVPGSNGDAVKAVQNVPGVARTTGELLVMRGESGGQALVNGHPVGAIFHFAGLRSTIGNGLIQSVQFTPGNYDARYGNTNAGIIDIVTRRPGEGGWHGRAHVDLFDAGLFVEGPAGKNATFAVGARRSYIDGVLKLVLSDEDKRIFRTAPRYHDYLATYDWRAGAHRVRFNLFGSEDVMVLHLDKPLENDPAVRGELRNLVRWVTGQLLWDHRLSDKTHLAHGVSYLWGHFAGALASTVYGQFRPHQATWRSDLTHEFAPWLTARAGLHIGAMHAFIGARAPRTTGEGLAPPILSSLPTLWTSGTLTTVNPAAYAALDVRLGALLLMPTVRVDHFSGVDRFSGTSLVQPRLNARWSVGESTTVKAGVGFYSRYPDVTQVQRDFGNEALGPELSRQYSAGIERGVAGAVRIDAVAFYKDLYRQVSPVADPAIKFDNNGRGRVYGGELLLKREPGLGRLSGWAAYTVLRSERRESGKDRFTLYDYDQTHNLNVVAQLRVTPTFEIGARFRYVTGNPLTPVVGATFDSDSDIYTPSYGPTNSSRLDAFHQLDVRVDKHWFFKTWKLTAYVDVQNAYNRKNPEGKTYNYNYRQSVPLAGLPLIPSFGVKGEF